MLDRVTPRNGFAPQSEYVTHSDIIRFIRRYFLTLVTSILVGAGVAAAYAWTAVPLFTARAQLLIDSKIPLTLREQTGDGVFSLDTPQIESQIAVLRSEQIAEKVINRLDLVNDRDFKIEPDSGGLTAMLRFWREPPALPSEFEQLRYAMSVLQAGMDVRRVSVSYAIDISFSSPDAEKAARIANEMAEIFLQDQLATRANATRQGSDWLEGRIDELRKQMNTAALTVQGFRAKRDYRIVGRRDRGPDTENLTANSDTSGAGEDGNTLEELASRADTYRKIYESYLQAYAESVQRQSYPVVNARLITRATRPLGKSHPRTTLVLVFGLALGTLVGCGAAFVRHMLDWNVRSPRQLREEVGLECLGQIARYENRRSRGFNGRFARRTYRPNLFEIINSPLSSSSEGLKSVKTALGLIGKERPLQRIGICSTVPQEGKSMMAASLAALYSLSGARTLVIDADLRNSSISRGPEPKATIGLVEALKGEAPLEDCIVPGKNYGPDFLPIAGRPIINSGDVLASKSMHELLRQLPNYYDMVIVDLPPLTPAVDGLAMSSLLDGVIMVVEWGTTPVPQLMDSVHALRMAQANVLGAVLVAVPAEAMPG